MDYFSGKNGFYGQKRTLKTLKTSSSTTLNQLVRGSSPRSINTSRGLFMKKIIANDWVLGDHYFGVHLVCLAASVICSLHACTSHSYFRCQHSNPRFGMRLFDVEDKEYLGSGNHSRSCRSILIRRYAGCPLVKEWCGFHGTYINIKKVYFD